MLNVEIKASGRALSDIQHALETALESIENENTSGFDRNEDSDYSFEVTGEDDGTYSFFAAETNG